MHLRTIGHQSNKNTGRNMCHNANYDLEAFEAKFDTHMAKTFDVPTDEDAVVLKPLFEVLLGMPKISQNELRKLTVPYKNQKYFKNSFLIQALYILTGKGKMTVEQEDHVLNLLRVKRGKSHSGIISITTFMSGRPKWTTANGEVKEQLFTCKWNCYYCPNEGDLQPRSYLKQEPGVMRANRYGFDACQQVWARMETLYHLGHKMDGSKLEILILGGTFSSFPDEYCDEFIRDTYYAANVFLDNEKRGRKSMKEEININKDARCRIISVTLETRPDCINKRELIRFRSYGCTRVQLGFQHIDNAILKGVNRQCTIERAIKGLKLLKDTCFKCDQHWMPNLPNSSPEKDRDMLIYQLLGRKSETRVEQKGDISWEYHDVARPDLCGDQIKLYPTETTAYTEIEKWYREGKYVPYPVEDMTQLLYDTKKAMYPWIRVNRLVRDISKPYIICSSNHPNSGQIILDMLKQNGDVCWCTRCREAKEKEWDGTYQLVVRQYEASGGIEYFVSAESPDKLTLYGFARLRLCQPAVEVFPELEGCALIRELHVYSNMNPVGENLKTVQHHGIGKKLMATAEQIAKDNGYDRIAVISGIGVQRYYEKIGYFNDSEGKGDFMIKHF